MNEFCCILCKSDFCSSLGKDYALSQPVSWAQILSCRDLSARSGDTSFFFSFLLFSSVLPPLLLYSTSLFLQTSISCLSQSHVKACESSSRFPDVFFFLFLPLVSEESITQLQKCHFFHKRAENIWTIIFNVIHVLNFFLENEIICLKLTC